jgi:hypothetical protein
VCRSKIAIPQFGQGAGQMVRLLRSEVVQGYASNATVFFVCQKVLLVCQQKVLLVDKQENWFLLGF